MDTNNNNMWGVGLAIIIVVILGVVLYMVYSEDTVTTNEPVACTQEAKLCPDGSYVGRTGPECEFAACPSAGDDSTPWLSTSTPSATIKYPASLSTAYLTPTDWPPSVNVTDEKFSCTEGGEATARAGQTEARKINGRDYCVTAVTEGAAGSIYTEYAYAFPREDQTVILTFSVRAPQCGNYNEPERAACTKEQNDFNLDDLVDRIAESLVLRAS